MVEATIDQKAFQKAMRASPRRLADELRSALVKHHMRFSNKVQRTRMSGRPGLKAPTGTMRRGLQAGTAKVVGTGQNLAVRTAFTGPHGWFAHVHEQGMVITPKKADALVFTVGGHFVRTQSVTIPARLGFMDTWNKMTGELYQSANEAIGKALA
jgi:hypothetical protein